MSTCKARVWYSLDLMTNTLDEEAQTLTPISLPFHCFWNSRDSQLGQLVKHFDVVCVFVYNFFWFKTLIKTFAIY